jgi:hypothetical protein
VTRLLLDEMYPPALAVELRAQGVDCVAVLEAGVGLAGAPDDRVLAWAAAAGRAVVTENVSDFARLAGASAHTGIVLVASSRYPRSRSGLARLREVLAVGDVLDGLGEAPVLWLP